MGFLVVARGGAPPLQPRGGYAEPAYTDPSSQVLQVEGVLRLTARFSRAVWAQEENAKGHACACGCGRRVVVLPIHRSHGIPKYVPEHRPGRFGEEIDALHKQGFVTVADVATELQLQRNAVDRLADELLPKTRRAGSRHIRIFTARELARLRAALAKKADPRHDMSDAQWKKVAPIVSRTGRPGRSADIRGVVNAILWIQRTGMQWQALPKRYPPRTTCESHFLTWRLDGKWKRVCLAFGSKADGIRGSA